MLIWLYYPQSEEEDSILDVFMREEEQYDR